MNKTTVTPITPHVPMPNPNARPGRRPSLPFDELTEPGQSFGIVGKTKRDLANMISNQNRRHRRVADDGSIIEERHFFAKNVDPETDPDGATVRVFRNV